jgi:DNA-binding NtrC family response regulator
MEEKPFDVVITDLKMSRLGGMELLRRVKEAHPQTLVIVITGYATVSSAVEVMKLGAFDYLPKPFTPDELRSIVARAFAEIKVQALNRKKVQETETSKPVSHQLIGDSARVHKVIQMVRKVAPTDSTVLICGESGTGKELVARAIHANSRRHDRVFFAVDCGTLSGDLLESELFGYMKGAFTGASKDKDGIFTLADQGTVFLDEISNISLEVQGKLLRFLETREFLPRGATAICKVDIRLVLATNRDLKAMVSEGAFREDFYYRIHVYPIMMPPLRERKEDVLAIAYHFLNQFCRNMGKHIKGFDENAVKRLMAYEWPGNVRQLKNIVERAVILCDGEQISPKELALPDDPEPFFDHVPSTNEEFKRLKKEIRQKAVDRLEKDFVLNALMENDWNVTRAAGKVGLQRTNFHNLMRKHGIFIPARVKTDKTRG